MDINLSNKEEIFNAIKALRNEPDRKTFNQNAHLLASQITHALKTPHNGNPPPEIQMVLDRLTPDSSDDDLRAGARASLVWKLRTMDLKASEYGQLKDLLSPTSDNRCRVVDFGLALLLSATSGFSPDSLRDLTSQARERLRAFDWATMATRDQ